MSNDIRYVCLSDMHFGADTSLLTNLAAASIDVDPSEPSPVLIELVRCLRSLISANADKSVKPTLILNGDIFELALANTNTAIMAFERFIELAMPDADPLFDYCIYVNPGNHDHHLWAVARETQYMDFIESQKPGSNLAVPWHTTKIFPEKAKEAPESTLLTTVIRRFGKVEGYKELGRAVCRIAYPNFGLETDEGRKAVIFHHGHFIEPIYHLMSRLRTVAFPGRTAPTDIWDIEAENSSWIEFFWSTMGTSDSLSADIEAIYNKLQSRVEVGKLLDNFVPGVIALIRKHKIPSWIDRVVGRAISKLVKWFFRPSLNLEVHDKSDGLSSSARKGLLEYLKTPLLNQISDEKNKTMPLDLTFVFGHTHKPFACFLENVDGYSEWLRVYNSGGWVVDTPRPDKRHGGAAILINDELDVVSLNLYNESQKETDFNVYVKEAVREGVPKSKFFERIDGLVDSTATPWREFSKTVAAECKKYAENQSKRIERN